MSQKQRVSDGNMKVLHDLYMVFTCFTWRKLWKSAPYLSNMNKTAGVRLFKKDGFKVVGQRYGVKAQLFYRKGVRFLLDYCRN